MNEDNHTSINPDFSSQNNDQQSTHNINEQKDKAGKEKVNIQETDVKNANAAGIGALGRNDEKLPDGKGDGTGDAGDY